jgi:hypothetical protein
MSQVPKNEQHGHNPTARREVEQAIATQPTCEHPLESSRDLGFRNEDFARIWGCLKCLLIFTPADHPEDPKFSKFLTPTGGLQ